MKDELRFKNKETGKFFNDNFHMLRAVKELGSVEIEAYRGSISDGSGTLSDLTHIGSNGTVELYMLLRVKDGERSCITISLSKSLEEFV